MIEANNRLQRTSNTLRALETRSVVALGRRTMKTILACALSCAVWTTAVAAGFKVSDFLSRGPSGPFLELSYAEASGVSFADIVRALSLNQSGFNIRLLGEFDQETKDELIAYYKEEMPSDLEEALASSGNMNNSTIQPLAASFDRAFRRTSMFKDIEEHLAPRGLAVQRITHEKFNMPGGNIWVPDIWLEVKPHAQQSH